MNSFFSKETLHSLMKTPGGAMAMVILFIVFQYIFKLDFVCPCDLRYNIPFCLLYVVLPFGFVTLTVMLIDPQCTWECKLNGCRKWAHCSSIVKSLLLGSVWVITALIDGEIAVCFFANNVTAGQQDACVEVTSQSPEQQRTINFYVNVSRIIGLGVILIMSLLYAAYNACCRKTYRESQHKKYKDEHIEAFLNEELSKLGKADAEKLIAKRRNSTLPPRSSLRQSASHPAAQNELPNLRTSLLQGCEKQNYPSGAQGTQDSSF